MNNDIKEILVSEDDIISKCKELGKIISQDYLGKKPLLVGLLKGCVPFLAELMKHVTIPMEYDFMDINSYFGGTISTGKIEIVKDLTTTIKGRHVLIVEDIIDTALTLSMVIPILNDRAPKSIEIVALLDKPSGRKTNDVTPKYIGYTVGNQFVVGFGMDYQQLYRNLPYIGILKESVYK